MCLSDPQTAVASTLIRPSACPGDGTGTSRTSVAAGPGPGFVLTTAVILDGRREAARGTRDPGAGFALFLPLAVFRTVQSPAWSSRTNPPRVPAARAAAWTETAFTYRRTSSRGPGTRSLVKGERNFSAAG